MLLDGDEGGLDAFGIDAGHETSMLGIVHTYRLIDQHHRNAIANFVLTVQPRVIEKVICREVIERPLVLRAGEDLEQRLVESHASTLVRQDAVISRSSSATRSSHSSRVGASRLSRSNGSVFDGRTLNHQGPQSTVNPSRRS
jgi:hypothetical protein